MSSNELRRTDSGPAADAALRAPRRAPGTRPDAPRLVLLSTNVLTGRILLHTGLLEALSERACARVWADRKLLEAQPALWGACAAEVDPFPAVRPYREFPYNVLRRLNDYAWDFRVRPPSKMSIWKHVRRSQTRLWLRALRGPGRLLAALGLEEGFERRPEAPLPSYPRRPPPAPRL